MSHSSPKYRPDIDGLRAVAVGIVVLFHAFPHVFQGGFIGVDVFFVISGFLITTIIVGDLREDRFSFLDFYSRRIRRIFPALLALLVAVLVVGYFILFDFEFAYIGRSTVGALGFFINFMLLREQGYFDIASELKPLLHLWSLAIEEQFYLVWPLVVVIFWRAFGSRKESWLALSIFFFALLSFAANVVYVSRNPSAGFYLPFTRGWELFAGGLLAVKRDEFTRVVSRAGSVLSALALVVLFVAAVFLKQTGTFPGWWALVPVAAAMTLIAGRDTFIHARVLSHPWAVWVGLISYPLYLWHWAIFSYLRIASGHQAISSWIFVAAIALSIAFAWLTYKFIETPVRAGRGSASLKVASLVALALLVAGTGHYVNSERGITTRSINQKVIPYDEAIAWPWIMSEGCDLVYGSPPEGPFCVSSKAPRVFLLGDSHANQYFVGLFEKVATINAGNGAPLDGVQIKMEKADNSWSRNLISLEKSKAFIEKMQGRIHTVIIASAWEPLANGNFLGHGKSEAFGEVRLVPQRADEAGLSREVLLERSLSRTIGFVESRGARVILALDAPEITFSPHNCFRQLFVTTNGCVPSIDRKVVDQRQSTIRRVFSRLQAKHPTLRIYDPIPMLCTSSDCPYFDEKGIPLYRDDSHISAPLSRRLGVEILKLLASGK